MTAPITYTGSCTAPVEMTAILNHQVIATAANDSDAYVIATRPAAVPAVVAPKDRP